jgi:HK97 family phage portal protein
MGIMDSFKNLFSGYSRGSLASLLQMAQANYPVCTFETCVNEGYYKNEVVFACVNKIASSFPEAPLRLFGPDGAMKPMDPTAQLMKHPNPHMTEFELWERTVTHFLLAGNAFWVKVRSGGGRVVQVWVPRPDKMRVVTHPTEFIDHYLLQVGNERYPLPKEDVIHFKNCDPLDSYFGLPPLQAAFRQLCQDNEATDFAKALLQNRAMPGTVVTTQDEDMDEKKADRLREKWIKLFGRNGDRGGPLFFKKGMDVKTLGLNMEELAFPDLRAISETRICAVYEVPPILLGLKVGLDRSTFSNYESARQHFWEETICPMHTRFAAVINNDPDFGRDRNAEARFDISGVTALRGVRMQLFDRGIAGWNSGTMRRDEARRMMGLAPVGAKGGGEDFHVAPPPNNIPLTSNKKSDHDAS